jgi:transcription elongation factor
MTNRFIPAFAAIAIMISAGGAFATPAVATDAKAPAATDTTKAPAMHKKAAMTPEHKAVWTKCRAEHKGDKKAVKTCVTESKKNLSEKAPAKN